MLLKLHFSSSSLTCTVSEWPTAKFTFLKPILIHLTATIAIAAALGVAILILLVILLYCLCKGKKKSSQLQRVPVNTVPVTSMEDRERLVYNSTTKPIWPSPGGQWHWLEFCHLLNKLFDWWEAGQHVGQDGFVFTLCIYVFKGWCRERAECLHW